jgi:bacillithiol system protein YtxJ
MVTIIMLKINTMEELKQLYAKKEPYLLMKHSLTCPISSEAFEETETFAGQSENLPVYYLNVQEFREGSSDASEHFQIKHESPQAFLVSDGKVVWHDSHWRITNEKLRTAAENLN